MVSQFERCLKDNFLQLFLSRFCAYRWQWGRDECDRSMGLILSREADCFFFPQRGNFAGPADCHLSKWGDTGRKLMNGLIYLVGLIVVILAVLSFFGLR